MGLLEAMRTQLRNKELKIKKIMKFLLPMFISEQMPLMKKKVKNGCKIFIYLSHIFKIQEAKYII